MKIELERFTSKPFFISLAGVTLVYFAAVRFFQDWLYHAMGIDGRPADMFLSFGPKFSQAEPFEIVLYLLGYVAVPVMAYWITPLMVKLLSYCHSKLDLESRNKQQTEKEFKSFGFLFSGFRVKARNDRGGRWIFFLALFGIVGLIVAIILFKFPFERAFDYVQTHSLVHVFWFVVTKRIFVSYLLLALSAVFFFRYYYRLGKGRSRLAPTEATRVMLESRIKKFWPLGLIILIIFIFNPNFPIDDHHSNYFVGSVHEVYQGKALLYESSNLYGLFSIYFLLALYKLIPLTFTSFTAVIMAVYVVFFSSLWVFVRKWLNSYVLATLALIPIIAIMYFFQTSPTRSALFLPAMSPFRWGLYLVVMFLMRGFERTRKSKYLHWSLLVAAFSLFWNFDSGLFLSAATLGTIGYLKLYNIFHHSRESGNPENKKQTTKRFFSFFFFFLDPESKFRMTLRKIFAMLVEYIGYVVGLFVATSTVNRLVYGSWPHWELFFRESKYFNTGIAMYPLPKIGAFEILFLVYAVVLVLMVESLLSPERSVSGVEGSLGDGRDGISSTSSGSNHINIPLMFLALYGVFSFIYYIGESSWQILYVVVVPFILIVAFAYQKGLLTNFAMAKNVSKLSAGDDTGEGLWQERWIRSGFAAIIFFGIALLVFKLPVEFSVRSYDGIAERFSSIDPADQHTYDDARYLAEQYSEHRIPVMSLNDTKLMMYSGKVNWLDFYYIFTIYFRSEMQKYIDQVVREQPQYILVGKDEYRNDQVEYFLNGVKDQYSLKESLQTVEVYQLKNKK